MLAKLKRGPRRAENVLRRLFHTRDPLDPKPQPEVKLNYANWDGLGVFVGILNKNVDAFGPLRSAVSQFSRYVETFELNQHQARACQEYAKLGADMNDLFHILARYFNSPTQKSITRDRITNLTRVITKETERLLMKEEEDRLKEEPGTGDVGEVLKCYRRVRTQLALFAMSENTSMWNLDGLQVQMSISRPDRLSHAPEAHYRGAGPNGERRTGCIPNTRVDALQELQDWVHYGKFQPIYWLNGTAGTGKTTIAYSLCEYLENSGKPFASFFCSQQIPECRNVNDILPSISYQLARLSRPFRCEISSVPEQDPDVSRRPIDEQFKRLMAVPLRNVGHTFGVDVVIVLDGLEECEYKNGVNQILDACFAHSSDLPLRFLITSRPNIGILDRMRASQGGSNRSELHLHEVDRAIARNDVKTYLTANLERLSLPPDDLECLAQRSGGSFVYAASVVQYIGQDTSRAAERIKLLDLSSPSGITINRDMDALYATMLEEATDESVVESSRRDEITLMLRVAVCAREPLTVNTIAGLLRLDFPSLIGTTFRSLLPVLHVSDASGLGVTLSEPFANYLMDPQRSGRFYCDVEQDNALLARLCLDFIRMMVPAFNICNLESSYLLDREVAYIDEKMNEAIPRELLYASRYWGTHLALARRSENLLVALHNFLSNRLLLWMEVMNLGHRVSEGVELLHSVYTWLQAIECTAEIRYLVYDAWKFMAAFARDPVSDSTPHIYISALRFWPSSRPISKYYMPRLRDHLGITGGRLKRREQDTLTLDGPVACAAHSPRSPYMIAGAASNNIYTMDVFTGRPVGVTLEGHTDRVNSIAYSSNGVYIISGSSDNIIRIWDAHTGKPVDRPLKGHTQWVSSVAYSPNGAYIASGSYDKTIRIWLARTGKPVGRPLTGHTATVNSVAYSPDGATIASGSSDKTIRIWDMRTGKAIGQPLDGHTHWVSSVAYSPNGAHVVSGSYDNTIRIWDAHLVKPMGQPLEGHTHWINSVAYSLDGAYIASGSHDKTVRIWDAQTGKPVGEPLQGHTDWVTSVSYSLDNAYIVSGSRDHTIRIWEARTGKPVRQALEGIIPRFNSIAYSPDSSYVVSGDWDNTVSSWDTHTGERVGQPLEGHMDRVNSAAYSPDGASIVSGSSDKTVRIWDTRTGKPIGEPLNGHTDGVNSVAYAPSGAYIVSGSSDNTIRIWDARTGKPVGRPFEGHTSPVDSVMYSPDSAYVLSSSFDKTIRLWNARTGEPTGQPIEGHTLWANPVAYSPGGASIVSGFHGNTLCIWDLHADQPVGLPFGTHASPVNSVAYSPDGAFIISGSSDKTIRVWDSQTRKPVGEPLEGHTHWVNSVVYAPNGSYIASCSNDDSIRIWDAPELETQLVEGSSQTILPGARRPQMLSAFARYMRRTSNKSTGSTSQILKVGQRPNRWTLDKQGWVVNAKQGRLIWVPPDLRESLVCPPTRAIIPNDDFVILDFRNAKLGTEWLHCFDLGGPPVN